MAYLSWRNALCRILESFLQFIDTCLQIAITLIRLLEVCTIFLLLDKRHHHKQSYCRIHGFTWTIPEAKTRKAITGIHLRVETDKLYYICMCLLYNIYYLYVTFIIFTIVCTYINYCCYPCHYFNETFFCLEKNQVIKFYKMITFYLKLKSDFIFFWKSNISLYWGLCWQPQSIN